MSEYRVRVEGRSHQGDAYGTGAARPLAVSIAQFNAELETNANYAGALVLPFGELWDNQIDHVWMRQPIPGGEVPRRAEAIYGWAEWAHDMGATNTRPGNTFQPVIQQPIETVGGTTIRTRRPTIILAGAALAEYTAPPTEVYGVVYYKGYVEAVTYAQGTLYLDTSAGESLSDPTSFLQRAYRELTSTLQARLPDGTQVPAATAIGSDPTGLVWISPGDVGNAANQIPTSLANNSASHYAYHPSVFWRRSSGIRDVHILERIQTPVTQQYGEMLVRVINTAPTASEWAFIIDGELVSGIVRHPAGTDYRRPRDIWSYVIRPMIESGGTVNQFMYTTFVAEPDRFFRVNRVLRGMNRLEYARFVQPLDDTTATPWTYLEQSP